jgi:hypothetical protein
LLSPLTGNGAQRGGRARQCQRAVAAGGRNSCFLQFMTDGYLLSTPHKVRLNTRERFA